MSDHFHDAVVDHCLCWWTWLCTVIFLLCIGLNGKNHVIKIYLLSFKNHFEKLQRFPRKWHHAWQHNHTLKKTASSKTDNRRRRLAVGTCFFLFWKVFGIIYNPAESNPEFTGFFCSAIIINAELMLLGEIREGLSKVLHQPANHRHVPKWSY